MTEIRKMKLIGLTIAACLLASPAMACTVAKNGDYLLTSGDPTLPVLMHDGKFIQCSSVLSAEGYAGQVMDCGTGPKPLRLGSHRTYVWGDRVFSITTNCPAVPDSMRAEH